MMFKLIDELKRASPKKRIDLLTRMHARNVEFFGIANPQIAEFIRARGTGRFEIRVTNAGLEILDRRGQQQYHPEGQLFSYMSDLGAWHHSGWVDKVLPLHINRGDNEHGRRIIGFIEGVYRQFEGLGHQIKGSGEIRLPRMRDGRSYSGAVVFLGVFTGLHVMNYLNRTAVRDLFLIEPDLDRFALSCYFLDYEKVTNLTGRLLLHVGPEPPQNPIEILVGRAPVTSAAWVRLLPAYADGKFDDILARVSLRWRALIEIFVPFDREIRNLQYGWRNLKARRPMLHARPELSKGSIVAVVASGPSLASDMQWLRENQSRMIIFSSISSVRVLRENGIRVDYQCTLDTEIETPLFESLGMDPDVPLVAYFKVDPAIAERFRTVLLLHESGKANPVRFRKSIGFTHPTTGNLMMAVAAWLRPSRIVLAGLDLGFREASRSHVSGGWHDENEGSGHVEETGGRDHIKVRANFPESEGQILTLAYYNNARAQIEGAIASLGTQCEVINVADGAHIAGALPRRSDEMTLPPYPDKESDLKAIGNAFSTEPKEIWDLYEVAGKQLVEETRQALMKNLTLASAFSWPEWALSLDRAWELTLGEMLERHKDLRIEVFSKFIYDLLSEWYKLALLAQTHEQVAQVYEKGLEQIRITLDGLGWPEELDSEIESPHVL